MVDIILNVVLGGLYGAAMGFLKYLLLWRKLLVSKDNKGIGGTSLAIRMVLGFFMNAVVLLAMYFTRNIIPMNFLPAIIAAAVGLSLSGRLCSVQKIYSKLQ